MTRGWVAVAISGIALFISQSSWGGGVNSATEVAGEPTRVIVTQNNPALKPPLISEINPTFLNAPFNTTFFSTGYTWACRNGDFSSLEERFSTTRRECVIFSLPGTRSRETNHDWDRDYNGVASAALLEGSQGVFLARQGENKNEKIGDHYSQNTINSEVDAHSCYSGLHSGAYQDCWKAYNSFVNGTIVKGLNRGLSNLSVVDLGPILWPSTGYTVDGHKTSNGVRSPSVIAAAGYLYVFYNDTSFSRIDGRAGGLEVARADMANPKDALVFIPYFHGSFQKDNTSLPKGFSTEQIKSFFSVEGGRADPLWPHSELTNKFRVAHIVGTRYYLGVTEGGGFSGSPWNLAFRLSCDLVRWSDPVPIAGEDRPTWLDGDLHYPVFYNTSDGSETEINARKFELLGTSSHGVLVVKSISIDLPRSSLKLPKTCK
jgi:hypothetical protein